MLIKFEVKIELPIIQLGSLFERLEQVLDAVRGERRLTKDTHDAGPVASADTNGTIESYSFQYALFLQFL